MYCFNDTTAGSLLPTTGDTSNSDSEGYPIIWGIIGVIIAGALALVDIVIVVAIILICAIKPKCHCNLNASHLNASHSWYKSLIPLVLVV